MTHYPSVRFRFVSCSCPYYSLLVELRERERRGGGVLGGSELDPPDGRTTHTPAGARGAGKGGAEEQVRGFSRAKRRSFQTKKEAEQFLHTETGKRVERTTENNGARTKKQTEKH